MSALSVGGSSGGRVVALSGGVGGAKLAAGLHETRGPRLSVVVNTGDDFSHLGLHISPDIDSVLYALSGLNDTERGWGRANESWAFMEELERLGEESWFRLGDRDLAMHVARTRALSVGRSLGEVTSELAKRLGISAAILPMSDDPVRTRLHTDIGTLDFQDYFVRHQCHPAVHGLDYIGAEVASASPSVLASLRPEGLEAIIICPSNPYLSIAPMLAIPGIRDAITSAKVPVVAVSPLIGGKALKGPAAKLLQELDGEGGNLGIAQRYRGLIHGLIIDHHDAHQAESLGMPVRVASTIMNSEADQARLAIECLDFAGTLEE